MAELWRDTAVSTTLTGSGKGLGHGADSKEEREYG